MTVQAFRQVFDRSCDLDRCVLTLVSSFTTDWPAHPTHPLSQCCVSVSQSNLTVNDMTCPCILADSYMNLSFTAGPAWHLLHLWFSKLDNHICGQNATISATQTNLRFFIQTAAQYRRLVGILDARVATWVTSIHFRLPWQSVADTCRVYRCTWGALWLTHLQISATHATWLHGILNPWRQLL